MKKFALLAFLIIFAFSLQAKNADDDSNFEFSNNRASISGLLTSSDSWQLEYGYHYMFNKYIGVGGSIGWWSVYYVVGYASGNNWDLDSDDEKPWNMYMRPSIILKTPTLRLGQVDLGLYAEPGVMMNVPYSMAWIHQYTHWPEYENKKVSTNKGQWCAVDLRVGVAVNFGPCGFSAGYMMSNFDVYSQRRHLSYDGVPFSKFYPTKSFLQGAYLTASYYF